MNKIQTYILIGLVISLPLVAVTAHAQLNESDFAGAVTIYSSDSQGSGFFIDSNTVLTAAHVILDAKEISILESGSEINQPAEVDSVNQDCDVAELAVDSSSDTFLEISSEPVLPGMTVFAISSPIGRSVLSVGKVESANELFIITSVPVDFGSSGGPLLNSDRQVVGLVTKKSPAGNAVAVPIAAVTQCIAEASEATAVKPLSIAATETQMFVTNLSLVVSMVALVIAIIALLQARLKRRPIKITLPPTEHNERS